MGPVPIFRSPKEKRQLAPAADWGKPSLRLRAVPTGLTLNCHFYYSPGVKLIPPRSLTLEQAWRRPAFQGLRFLGDKQRKAADPGKRVRAASLPTREVVQKCRRVMRFAHNCAPAGDRGCGLPPLFKTDRLGRRHKNQCRRHPRNPSGNARYR